MREQRSDVGISGVPRLAYTDDDWQGSTGLVAVGPRLLLKLDGNTARVLARRQLRTLREIGTVGLTFKGVVGLQPPLVMAWYQNSCLLEWWNCKNGRVTRRLELRGIIKLVVMSPNGSSVVATTDEAEIVWIDCDGVPHVFLHEHVLPDGLARGLTQLAMAPDGSAVVVGTQQGEIFWIDSNGMCRGIYQVDLDPINAESESQYRSNDVLKLAVALDGSVAVAGMSNGEVVWVESDGKPRGKPFRIEIDEWSLDRRRRLGLEDSPDDLRAVNHLAMTPDGSAVAVGTRQGQIVWIGSDGVPRGDAMTLDGEISQLAIAPDGSAVVAGTDRGHIVWIESNGEPRLEVVELFGDVFQLAGGITILQMAFDGSAVVAGTEQGEIAWVESNGVPRGDPRGDKAVKLSSSIQQLVMAPDASLVVAGSDTGEVVWLGADCVARGDVVKLGGTLTQLAMSPDGNSVLAGTSRGDVAWIGSNSGSPDDCVQLAGRTTKLLIAPDNNAAVVVADTGEVAWIGSDGVSRRDTVKLNIAMAWADWGPVTMAPDGKAVVAATDTGEIAWIGSNGVPRGDTVKLDGRISQLEMAPDGNCVVAASDGQLVWVGSDGVARGDIVKLDGRVNKLQMAPDSSAVVVGVHGNRQAEVVWIGSDSVPRGDAVNLDGQISHLAIAPDGCAVVVGTTEGQFVWVGSNGAARGDVVKLDGCAEQLAMAPDGSAAVASTSEGKLVWIGSNGVSRGDVVKLGDLFPASWDASHTDFRSVTHLAMAPDGNAVVAIQHGFAAGAVVWIGTASEFRGDVVTFAGQVTQLVMASRGDIALVGTDKGEIVCLLLSPDVGLAVHRIKDTSDTGYVNMISPQKDGSGYLCFDSGDGMLIHVDIDNRIAVSATFDSRRLLQGAWAKDHLCEVLGSSLIFGANVSAMHALDTSVLLKYNVECVRTIGLGRETMEVLETAQEKYGSRVRYGLAVLKLYTTTTQFVSISFTRSIKWDAPPWIVDAITSFRNLGLSEVDLDIPEGSVQIAAMAFVAVTYLILTVQESVEEHVFMQDEGSWKSIWLTFDAFTSAVATVLFMPIVSVLLDPLVCVADTSLSSTSSADDGPLVMKTSSAIVCFESGHAALATVSMIALIGYTVVVLRLIRVQGNLESVEFSLRRFWQYQNDIPTPLQRAKHPLTEDEDDLVTLAAAGIISADVLLKLVNTLASKLLHDEPVLIAAIVMGTGAYLTFDSLGSPYEARSTNYGVMALNILILLSGCTSQVIALEPDSRIALVAQEAFGVATALIGLGTILALTPLGSRTFKNGLRDSALYNNMRCYEHAQPITIHHTATS